MNRDFKFKILYPLIGGVITILFTFLVGTFDFIDQFENFFLDMKYTISARDTIETEVQENLTQVEKAVHSDIMIMGIDEESVGMTDILGKFPWPRSVYGQLISYFDLDKDLLDYYDELIAEAGKTIRKLKPERKTVLANWSNEPFDVFEKYNYEALEYYEDNDPNLYKDLSDANIKAISRLERNEDNLPVLGEVKRLSEVIIKALKPQEDEYADYYTILSDLNNRIILYVDEQTAFLNSELDKAGEDEKQEIEGKLNQFELFKQTLNSYNSIIKEYLNHSNGELSFDILKTLLIDYIKNNLNVDNIESIPVRNDVINTYMSYIKTSHSKLISDLNKDAFDYYTANNKEDSIEDLNRFNTEIINILFRNEQNINILSNTLIVDKYVLWYLKPVSRNLDREKYYNNLTSLFEIVLDYMKNNGYHNSEDYKTIEKSYNDINILRQYYKKQYEKSDILEWNKYDIELTLDYNNGNIKPEMLFFDIFIDQPGETKIYELSSKRTFYSELQDNILNAGGYDNFNYDVFENTIEEVRGISDKKLFDALRELKDDNFVYWDYFGQYVNEGRLEVSDLSERLSAIEEFKISDNIVNPEVAIDKMYTYRDLKVPLTQISRNSAGIGAAMVEADNDGKLRSMPMLIKFYDERVDKNNKNKPLMEKPEFYMGIDLVLTMDYYNVKKEDLEIIMGDKIILKNATLPNKVVISHEYFDKNIMDFMSKEYYFNHEEIKKYFKTILTLPEISSLKIIHYNNDQENEEQRIVEDLNTSLSKVIPYLEKGEKDLEVLKYQDKNGNMVSLPNLTEDYYAIVKYGGITVNSNELKDIIKEIFGDTDIENINIVFSEWKETNNDNKRIEEVGRTNLKRVLENAVPPFGFMGIEFEDKDKGKIVISDLSNTEISISRGNKERLKMNVKEFIDFLSIKIIFSEISSDADNEDITNYEIPFYSLLSNGFKEIKVKDSKGKDFVINDIEKYNITFYKENSEKFIFDAKKLDKVLLPEPIIKDVHIPINEQGKFIINFQGNPGVTFETMPIYQLYSEPTSRKGDPGRANWALFKNRVILAGIYSSAGINTEGRKDTFQTPYGTMFGIEVHANALYTVFNQDFIKHLPSWADFLIQIGIVLLLFLILPRISILNGAIIGVFLILFIFVEGIAIFAIMKLNIHIVPQLITALVGFIAMTVVKLLSEEKEKAQIRGVFSTYVNAEVVNELLKDPEHALQLGGASKEITCFFSDIRGFTTLSEELKKVSETELVNRMNEYFTIMTDIVLKYKGTLDKYMGDAIMAFWGAPIEYDRHALLACKTAIEMIEHLPNLKAKWPENLRNFDIGIGINTGPAVAGNTGSELRKDYTILGDTVNLGSRLEGVNKTYGTRIIISEYTYEYVKDFVVARELDLIRVKGKTEPVRIYELIGLNEAGENYQIGDIRIKLNSGS